MNLKDTDVLLSTNKTVKLGNLVGEKGLVLYFFPKASTPGCTLETIEYNKHYEQFKAKGYEVAGISRDEVKKQDKFHCAHDLKFPLICDIDSELSNHFGVLKEKKMFNKVYMGIERSTFVLDKEMNIIKELRKVSPVQHIKEVLEII